MQRSLVSKLQPLPFASYYLVPFARAKMRYPRLLSMAVSRRCDLPTVFNCPVMWLAFNDSFFFSSLSLSLYSCSFRVSFVGIIDTSPFDRNLVNVANAVSGSGRVRRVKLPFIRTRKRAGLITEWVSMMEFRSTYSPVGRFLLSVRIGEKIRDNISM